MADTYRNLTLAEGTELSAAAGVDVSLQRQLLRRISSMATEHAQFEQWCDRADNLYFTTDFGRNGADLWVDDASETTPGRVHISVNDPAAYVDIPAGLQAQPPIENFLAREDSNAARKAAQNMERLREAWKSETRWDLRLHKAAVLKELYGRTAGYVYYEPDKQYPCIDPIQNPRNLWLGYKTDNYESIEWSAYVSLVSPEEVEALYGVEVEARDTSKLGDPSGQFVPWVVGGGIVADTPRPAWNYGPARVEVWDYWYRKPAAKQPLKGPRKMETWNVVIAGNCIVREPVKYAEYKGDMPYVPLFNTFIPGMPTGRPALWDIEPLIRETMERLTAGGQQIAGAVAGDYWQLVGPDVPAKVPESSKPKRGQVVSPGANNRIETITPFIAQFQLEQYLGRIDRMKTVVSGLNDLLLGLAPAEVLSSSKAINALIANYEARISMRRLLFYTWIKDTWDLAVKVWAARDKKRVQPILDAGGGVLDITEPSLSPRDDMETAQRAIALVNSKLWSQARGMDATGVDDPEQEQNIIRGERTDATMFPQDVQVMAQLLQVLQASGLGAPQGVQQQGQDAVAQGQNDLRTALGASELQVPNGPGESGPPVQPEAQVAGATPLKVQTMLSNGEASGRILGETQVPQGGGGY